jgi:hypothetical protein
MVASKRRSKKRSGASSARRPETSLIYFVDECLGRHFVAEALRKAGAQIEVHHDHFRSGVPDTEWLPVIGGKKWIVLTKDRQIRRRGDRGSRHHCGACPRVRVDGRRIDRA